MKTIITLARILLGILIGIGGFVALLNAPYQLLNSNFTLGSGGPFSFVSVIIGGLMVWAAWRLIRRPETHAPLK